MSSAADRRGAAERPPARLPAAQSARPDASNLRARNAELERWARVLDTTLSSITDFAYTFDREGRFVYVNKPLLDLWGMELDEAVGKTFMELPYPDDLAERLDRQIHQVFETGQRLTDETSYYGPNGAGGYYEYIFSPVFDPHGEVELVAGSTRDITERRRTSEERDRLLREAEVERKRLAELFQRAPSFMCILRGPDHVFERVNDLYYRLVGGRELLGKPLREALPEIEGQGFFELIDRVYQTGEVFSGTDVRVLVERSPGEPAEERFLDFIYQPLRDGDGTVTGIFVQGVDLTERRQAEEKLREQDRRKDEFMAMLAHELRNPIAAIRNGAEIIHRAAGDDGPVASASEMVERQVAHTAHLIDDLLDVSRISRGKIQLDVEPVELGDAVERGAEAARAGCADRNQHFKLTAPSEPVWLDADPARLRQVIDNLINNACKFTDPGGRIEVSAGREGEEAVVRVKDDGIGIPAEELPHLFETFTQIDTSLERSESGLGLGLTLVQKIVELHGGTVEAGSAGLGEGSEFVVRLPARDEAPEPARDDGGARPEQTDARTVLVVDDNEDSAKSLSLLLEIWGHEVDVAYDGREALERAGELRPEAILLDIGLPHLNGYDVCRRIREQPWGTGVTIIASTGWGQDEDRRKAEEAGFDAHLTKPIDYDALKEMLA